MQPDHLLELRQITKSFGNVRVLSGINLTLKAGNILGLVGENGAGKSTTMNILSGIFSASSGEMYWEQELFEPGSPQEALKKGIALIHQELNLFPNLSITENLFLSALPFKYLLGIPVVDWKVAHQRARKLLENVGLSIAPDTLVQHLSPAHRQLVEITKALSVNPKLIIFDEPTTSLTRHEASKLFRLIERLKQEGMAIIYISHNLDDVIFLCDQIAVMRDGNLVEMYEKKAEFDQKAIIKAMVGRDLSQLFPVKKTVSSTDVLLKATGIKLGNLIKDVSFTVSKHEIVGFYGLVGAGRSELARAIYGLDIADEGEIIWKGQKVSKPNPSKWIREGVAFVTEDRREEGLLLEQSVNRNISLAAIRNFTSGLSNKIAFSELEQQAATQAKSLGIKYADLNEQAVSTLSGGNQQKVILAKWLLTRPELLILDEPTKGIDIGAKQDIYNLIHELAAGGSGILLISSEIEELMGLCDRILVMNRGRLTKEIPRSLFSQSDILEAALHTTSSIS